MLIFEDLANTFIHFLELLLTIWDEGFPSVSGTIMVNAVEGLEKIVNCFLKGQLKDQTNSQKQHRTCC